MKNVITLVAVAMMAACSGNAGIKNSIPTGEAHKGHEMPLLEMAGYCDSVNVGLIKEDTLKGSPARTAMNTVHGIHVHIAYNSPGVKHRVIWGGLVPYGQVWVTGAHQATRITFYKEVVIAGKKIPSGTYAIFTVPGEKEWTIILNKNYEQHLADSYNEKDDVLRFITKPEVHPFTARLTFGVEELAGNDGIINILWEKIKLVLLFKTA